MRRAARCRSRCSRNGCDGSRVGAVMSESSPDHVLEVLRATHERLAAAFDELGEERAGLQSYCDDWSVAQVASHLGSGSEIFRSYLAAGASGKPAPGNELNQPVWDAWNAKTPTRQIRDWRQASNGFLSAVDALTPEQRASWELDLFGMHLDLPAFLRMRLNENTMHTWDVTVALDPASTIPEESAALVAGDLAMVAGWAGKPCDRQASVEVRTTSPERAFHLDVGPSGVALSPSLDDTSAASLSLPTEAFVRLVYGRLDPDHTPSSTSASGVDLDLLRSVFPGL
jgi:uncharacterized protein (TIGR03083 family)